MRWGEDLNNSSAKTERAFGALVSRPRQDPSRSATRRKIGEEKFLQALAVSLRREKTRRLKCENGLRKHFWDVLQLLQDRLRLPFPTLLLNCSDHRLSHNHENDTLPRPRPPFQAVARSRKDDKKQNSAPKERPVDQAVR